jgi:hypothetical protein
MKLLLRRKEKVFWGGAEIVGYERLRENDGLAKNREIRIINPHNGEV